MKTLIINGSPKTENSNSEILVNKLNHYLNTDAIQINIKNYKAGNTDTPIERRKRTLDVSSDLSAPVTSSPSLTSAVASALIPTPPIPIRCRFTP